MQNESILEKYGENLTKNNYITNPAIGRDDEINKMMPLEISEKPDSLIRVLMEYKPLDKYIDVQGDGSLVITKINDNSNYYGTGSIIDVYDNVTGELVESFRIIIFGDIDGDSYANGIDLSMMSEEALGLTGWSIEGIDEYCAYKFKAANLRPDGVIEGQDKALLNRHVLSLGYINQVTGLVES